MEMIDKAEHLEKVQELYKELAAVHKELADALRAQSKYRDYWIEEMEKNEQLKNGISISKSPEVGLIELGQEKTTSASGG